MRRHFVDEDESERTRAIPPSYVVATPDFAKAHRRSLPTDEETRAFRDGGADSFAPIDQDADELLTRVAAPSYGALSELPRMSSSDHAPRGRRRTTPPADAVTCFVQRSSAVVSPNRDRQNHRPNGMLPFQARPFPVAHSTYDAGGIEEGSLEDYLDYLEDVAPPPRAARAFAPPAPRPARAVAPTAQPIQPAHPHDSSVDSPWTFATGVGSWQAASASLTRRLDTSKLHAIAAAALTFLSIAVIVASALAARAGHHERYGSASAAPPHVAPRATPRKLVLASATKRSVSKKELAAPPVANVASMDIGNRQQGR